MFHVEHPGKVAQASDSPLAASKMFHVEQFPLSSPFSLSVAVLSRTIQRYLAARMFHVEHFAPISPFPECSTWNILGLSLHLEASRDYTSAPESVGG